MGEPHYLCYFCLPSISQDWWEKQRKQWLLGSSGRAECRENILDGNQGTLIPPSFSSFFQKMSWNWFQGHNDQLFPELASSFFPGGLLHWRRHCRSCLAKVSEHWAEWRTLFGPFVDMAWSWSIPLSPLRILEGASRWSVNNLFWDVSVSTFSGDKRPMSWSRHQQNWNDSYGFSKSVVLMWRRGHKLGSGCLEIVRVWWEIVMWAESG